MRLELYPIRADEPLLASITGDVLTLNGEALDFGPLPIGATLPRAAITSDWIAGDVSRDASGELTVPLLLPHGANPPYETRFPTPVVAGEGPVALPAYDAAPELEGGAE